MSVSTPWVFVYQHLKNLRKAEANPEEISIARSLDFAAREGYLRARQIEYARAELAAYRGECTSVAAAAYKAGMFPRGLDPLGPTDRYEFEIDFAAWLAGFTDGETVPWAAQGRRSFVFIEARASQYLWSLVAEGYDGWARHSRGTRPGYLCSRISDLRDGRVLSLEEYQLLGREIDSYVNPVNAKGFLSYITTSAATLGAWPSDLARDVDGHAEFRRRFVAWKAGQPHGELPWAVNDLPAANWVEPKAYGVHVTAGGV